MDYYVSQIALFPYGYEPKGWILCDGRTLNIRGQEMLYSILTTRFGGDGKNNFKIPNLKNVSPVQLDGSEGKCEYYICIRGMYPVRAED